MAAGCSGKSPGAVSGYSPETEQTEENRVVVDHVLPVEYGAFVRHGNSFERIESGDPGLLMATNADRGFGFGLPTGTVLNGEVQDITLTGTPLKDTVLQITEFKGIASVVDRPTQEVDDSNIAWIPVARHPVEVQVIDKKSGIVDIHVKEPLKPGFYVLHDETMIRSRHAKDVTAYYPFVVLDKSGKRPWIKDAEECFKQHLETAGMVPSLDAPSETVKDYLEKCLTAQRIAWKTEAAAATQTYQHRIMLLRRILYPGYADAQRDLKREMNPEASDLTLNFWEVTHSDHLQRLITLSKQAKAEEPLDVSMVEMVVQYYLDQRGIGQPLNALLWYPFSRIDSESEVLGKLFDSIISEQAVTAQLLSLLGAIEYRDIQQTVNQSHPLAVWFKSLSERVPAEWRKMASSLKLNDLRSSLFIGPFHFENIPESEWSSWRATVKSKQGRIEACLQEKSVLESAMMILDQPLHQTAPGLNAVGILKDPIGNLRSLPVMSPETVNCILKVLQTLPGEPALESDKRFQMGIVWIKP